MQNRVFGMQGLTQKKRFEDEGLNIWMVKMEILCEKGNSFPHVAYAYRKN